jgi:hypothetical protein
LDVDSGILEKIKQTRRELNVRFPAKMDDGMGAKAHELRGIYP